MNESEKKPKSGKTKALVFVAALFVLAVIAFLLINPLTGNPVSRLLVENAAKKHISQYDSALNLQIERIGYNFKDGCYYAHFLSPINVDIHFAVAANGWGKILSDHYEDHVTSGWNTAMRLDEEYRALVDAVLEADRFPYVCDIGYGDLLFADFSVPAGSAGCLNMSDLEIGKEYDIPALARDYGKLTIYVDSGTVTVEEASKVLLELKQWMDDASVPFFLIDFTLQYPRSEENGARPDGTVMVLDFLYENIYAEGMADRVQAAYEAALAYYNEQDAMKDAEPTEW